MHPLSADETRKLLEAARGDKLEALYVLAIHTGMRQGELLALKWSDVDLENAVISVRRTLMKSGGCLLLGEPKTKKSRRTIQLTEERFGHCVSTSIARWSTSKVSATSTEMRASSSPARSELLLTDQLAPAFFRVAPDAGRAAADPLPRPQAHLRHAAAEP
jgi:hypothetical protein